MLVCCTWGISDGRRSRMSILKGGSLLSELWVWGVTELFACERKGRIIVRFNEVWMSCSREIYA